MLVTDATSLRALQKLNELLGEFESEEEDTESEDESLVEELEAIALNEGEEESGEKENETKDSYAFTEKGTGRGVSDRTRRQLTSANK